MTLKCRKFSRQKEMAGEWIAYRQNDRLRFRQTRVVQLLIERVDYDGHRKKVAVTFHPDGIREFSDELGEDAE